MILVDTGPLVALLNRNDPLHSKAVGSFRGLRRCRMITTWPCLTEMQYFLGKVSGRSGQRTLERMIRMRHLEIRDLPSFESSGLEGLMDRYEDVPMDFADGSLVVLAEMSGCHRVITFDGHFFAYRLSDGTALDVIIPY